MNGVEAMDAPHEGGNLPFSVDITPCASRRGFAEWVPVGGVCVTLPDFGVLENICLVCHDELIRDVHKIEI